VLPDKVRAALIPWERLVGIQAVTNCLEPHHLSWKARFPAKWMAYL